MTSIALTTTQVKWPSKCIRLQWRHDGRDGVSNHQPHDCLLNRLFRRRSKETPKLCVAGLCVGNSPVTDGFPAQMASNAENVSIGWRHHDIGALVWLIHIVRHAFSVLYPWYRTTLINRTHLLRELPSNLNYEPHQIPKVKCFSSRLAVAFMILRPGDKSRMKMYLEQRRQAILQLHLSEQQLISANVRLILDVLR